MLDLLYPTSPDDSFIFILLKYFFYYCLFILLFIFIIIRLKKGNLGVLFYSWSKPQFDSSVTVGNNLRRKDASVLFMFCYVGFITKKFNIRKQTELWWLYNLWILSPLRPISLSFLPNLFTFKMTLKEKHVNYYTLNEEKALSVCCGS